MPFDFYTPDRKREFLSKLIENGKESMLGAEVGVWKGDTSDYLLSRHANLSMVCVDPYPVATVGDKKQIEHSLMHKLAFRSDADANQIYQLALSKLEKFSDRAKLIRRPSLDAVNDFASELFDFVYIDADHHYEAVKADILAWLPKVKKGGWLIGDDFAWDLRYDQVAKAVIECFGYRFGVLADVWFVKKSLMQIELKNFKRILDIGGGHNALKLATDVVDWRLEEKINGKQYHRIDVCSEPLPFADREIDFIYCRHALEDLHNPEFALREMNRVSKCGYIETPHVLTELRKGIQNDAFRGWAHHFWFVWSVGNKLKLLPKSAALVALQFDDGALTDLESRLQDDTNIKNHYFIWENGFEFQVLKNGIDFDYTKDYHEMVKVAIEESIRYRNIISYSEE